MVGRWDRQLALDFVKKYVELNVLWNAKNPLHKSAKARMKAYKVLQAVVQPTEPNFSILDVRNKIKGFRSMYCVELKKVQRSKNQAYVPTLPWFQIMDDVLHKSALDNIVKRCHMTIKSTTIRSRNKRRPASRPNSPQTTGSYNSFDFIEFDPSTTKIKVEDSIDTTTTTCGGPPTVVVDTNLLNSTTTATRCTTNEMVDDEFDIFGKSIAIQLRKLPLEQALKTQLDIQTLLINVRLNINNNPERSTYTDEICTSQATSSVKVDYDEAQNYTWEEKYNT